jgi:transcriptional regulator GlxA family with amidase domain
MAVSISTFFKLFQPMPDFTILLFSGAYASSVALTLDILTAAASMAARLNVAAPTWQLRAFAEGPIRLSNNLYIDAKPMSKRIKPDNSIWIIPGLATNSASAVNARILQSDTVQAIKALIQKANTGGTIAASCSAVFLLQAANLLKNKKVTTTWWLSGHLQNIEPTCILNASRLVIADGNIWTAGAALAQTDLMLRLISHRFGAGLADAVSRILLIDNREAQAPFIAPNMLTDGNDFIAELSKQIDAALPGKINAYEIAAKFRISERTLARRVKASTGNSTLSFIQLIRLKRARILLETSNMSVDEISENVGYSDATALRRLMRKTFGATPRQFRPSMKPL